MVLSVERLVCRLGQGRPPVLDGIDLTLEAGQVLCLLGPNGAGKTTLLRCLIGALQPDSGQVRVVGETRADVRQRARQLAYVPQAGVAGSLCLLDVVLMGRTPHLQPLAQPGTRDRRIAAEALERVGVAHLAMRPFDRVSGGERQLALIARALAQQPRLFLMDEPTAGLDLGNQVRVLEVIADLRGDGVGLLLTSHQPEHALLLGSQAALLENGRIRACGPAAEVLDAPALSSLYGVELDVLSRDGVPAACAPRLPKREIQP